MDQPTISRVARSLMAARYSQPSPVGMYEMSASQTASGRSAAKSWSSRLGAIGKSCRLSVVRGVRRRPRRAESPISRMSRATRSRPIRTPSSRSSACTRGLP
jgi:hypothetical protein